MKLVKNKKFLFFLIIVFFLLSLCNSLFSMDKIILDKYLSKISIEKSITIYEDSDNSWSPEEFIFHTKKFNSYIITKKSLKYSDSTIWIKFTLQNFSKKRVKLFLVFENPILDDVRFYRVKENKIKEFVSGDVNPFNIRKIKSVNHIFPINIRQGKETFFLRIRSTSNLNFNIYLINKEKYFHNEKIKDNISWFIAGLLIAMMLYNFLLAISTRDKTFLYLSFFIFSYVFFELSYSGYAFKLLWSNSLTWASMSDPFFLSLTAFWGIMFSKHFLNTKFFVPIANNILNGLLVIHLIGVFIATFGLTFYRLSLYFGQIGFILAIIVIFYSAIKDFLIGYKISIFFLIGSSFFFLSTIVVLIANYHIVANNFLSQWGMQIGFSGMIVFLSLGLANEINVMKNKLEKSHDDLLLTNVKLDKEKDQLNITLRSIGDAVISIDTEGILISLNKAAEKLIGWRQKEANGHSIQSILKIVDDHGRNINIIEDAFHSEEGLHVTAEYWLKSKTGKRYNIEYNASQIKSKKNNLLGIVIVIRDITDKKQLEKEIQKQSMLKSIGILAGGIAHDFNNILTALVGNLSLIKIKIKQDDEIYQILDETERATFRARSLTKQLLTFSKGGAPIRQPEDIKKLLREVATFTLSGSNHKIQFSIQPDLWSIEIDEGQISQGLNNIILNAIQSMDASGVIAISATNTTVTEESCLPVLKGNYIKISISDQGKGISKESLNKIFEPYFSTKENGTGLGLASSYSIIKNHNGHIFVDSVVGKGSTFDIFLPAEGKTIQGKNKKIRNQKISYASNKGKILIMDDEEIILKTTGALLKNIGYDVTLSKNGKEAIEIYKDNFNKNIPFDAILMDLTIPGGMGGKEAVAQILEFDPKAKVVVSSGYSNDPVMANYKDYGFYDIAVKPYTIEILSKIFERVFKG